MLYWVAVGSNVFVTVTPQGCYFFSHILCFFPSHTFTSILLILKKYRSRVARDPISFHRGISESIFSTSVSNLDALADDFGEFGSSTDLHSPLSTDPPSL